MITVAYSMINPTPTIPTTPNKHQVQGLTECREAKDLAIEKTDGQALEGMTTASSLNRIHPVSSPSLSPSREDCDRAMKAMKVAQKVKEEASLHVPLALIESAESFLRDYDNPQSELKFKISLNHYTQVSQFHGTHSRSCSQSLEICSRLKRFLQVNYGHSTFVHHLLRTCEEKKNELCERERGLEENALP